MERQYIWPVICGHLIGFSVIGFLAGWVYGMWVTFNEVDIPYCYPSNVELTINGHPYDVYIKKGNQNDPSK